MEGVTCTSLFPAPWVLRLPWSITWTSHQHPICNSLQNHFQRLSQTSPSHRDPSLPCNPDAVTFQGPSSLSKNPTTYLILLVSLLAFPSLLISSAAWSIDQFQLILLRINRIRWLVGYLFPLCHKDPNCPKTLVILPSECSLRFPFSQSSQEHQYCSRPMVLPAIPSDFPQNSSQVYCSRAFCGSLLLQ